MFPWGGRAGRWRASGQLRHTSGSNGVNAEFTGSTPAHFVRERAKMRPLGWISLFPPDFGGAVWRHAVLTKCTDQVWPCDSAIVTPNGEPAHPASRRQVRIEESRAQYGAVVSWTSQACIAPKLHPAVIPADPAIQSAAAARRDHISPGSDLSHRGETEAYR